jgi:hypothetical protein
LVPNKPNSLRFWAKNEGWRKSKANLGGRGGRDFRFQISDWRLAIRGGGRHAKRGIAPNKANFPCFGAENGGGAKKQSQSKPIAAGWRREAGDWRKSVRIGRMKGLAG